MYSFLRFSTVQGARGSADTVRDVRGFSTRFYTDEGNWDIVGNDIPVFFIQNGIEFPDLIHAYVDFAVFKFDLFKSVAKSATNII